MSNVPNATAGHERPLVLVCSSPNLPDISDSIVHCRICCRVRHQVIPRLQGEKSVKIPNPMANATNHFACPNQNCKRSSSILVRYHRAGVVRDRQIVSREIFSLRPPLVAGKKVHVWCFGKDWHLFELVRGTRKSS